MDESILSIDLYPEKYYRATNRENWYHFVVCSRIQEEQRPGSDIDNPIAAESFMDTLTRRIRRRKIVGPSIDEIMKAASLNQPDQSDPAGPFDEKDQHHRLITSKAVMSML